MSCKSYKIYLFLSDWYLALWLHGKFLNPLGEINMSRNSFKHFAPCSFDNTVSQFCFGFVVLSLVFVLEKITFYIQWEVHVKPNRSWLKSTGHFPSSCQLPVFMTSNFDWFTEFTKPFLTGQSHHFWF